MSSHVELSKPEILISNLSLPPALILAGSLSAYERYMDTTKANGMEVTPVRSLFMHKMLFRATMIKRTLEEQDSPGARDALYSQIGYDIAKDWTDEDEAYTNIVRSQHSSFRNDTGDRTIMAYAFPTWRDSLVQMDQVQYITGKLPAVLYPGFEDNTVVYNQRNAPFADRTFQPSVKEWDRLRLKEDSSVQEITETINSRGFTSLTIDVLHLQRSHEGKRFERPIEFATRLAKAGLVRSIHLSLARLDSTGSDSDLAESTKYAYKAFTSSAEKAKTTLEGELLSSITATWQAEGMPDTRIVLEEDPRRSLNKKRDQTAIIENTREIIARP